MAHVLVVGNEKGGSGKTTISMHLLVSLLKLGFSVGSMDLDSRQQSLSRYIENRKLAVKIRNVALLLPEHVTLSRSDNKDINAAEQEDEEIFLKTMSQFSNKDFIVIDTPGSDAFLSRLAHSYADTIITPMNDSFIDVDLLGNIGAETLDSTKPGIYSAMVWEQKLKSASRSKKEIKWIVVRNRLSALDAKNKRNIDVALTKLSRRFGFKIAPGFGDRVVFKELFLHGLTLHDANNAPEIRLTTSVIAARQELREFIKALEIAEIFEKVRVDENNLQPSQEAA